MPNNRYCTVPWNEVHINADGTYHACGSQPNWVSNTEFGLTHNVHNMTIREWMQSKYQTKNRQGKLNNEYDELCTMCYQEESVGKSSKREREIAKYPVIPIEFQQVDTNLLPVSYHMSLGNECNFACRMCRPEFSSSLAAEYRKLNLWNHPIKLNWTEDTKAWNMVIDTIKQTPNLKAVHIIGGEPLLNDRFEKIVDALIESKLTNIYIGFTTNGSIFNRSLVEKLSVFNHVDVGVSVETKDRLNDFIRRGSTVNDVLNNIKEYLPYRKPGHFYVTVRTVPSALSVHTIDELFQWCVDHELDIMSNILVRPEFLRIVHLPDHIKQRLLKRFDAWQYSTRDITGTNPRDPNYYKEHIDHELKAIVNLLKMPADPQMTQRLYRQLELWGWMNDSEIKQYFL